MGKQNLLLQVLKGLLDFVYPPICFVCHSRSEKEICDRCLKAISFIKEPVCYKCGKPTLHQVTDCLACRGQGFKFISARAVGLYKGVLKEALHCFKYQNGKRLAPIFADLMTQAVDKWHLKNIQAITYVPLTARKEIARGYNQSKLLASSLSKNLQLPLLNLLKKCRETAEQSSLTFKDRKGNVKGAFQARSEFKDSVLLVDDIFTTGSTVQECTKALRKAGVSNVYVITVARVILS
jgi:ComF family protein